MASAAIPAPPPAPPVTASDIVPYRGLITVAVMMAMVMQILDTTIANVALPHMQSSLGATLDSINWVLTSYLLATAISIPVTGWLADRFGSRNLFIFAVAGFVLASMLCGIAQNLPEMVLFRFFQGVCAAFIGPLSQTVLLDINPPERHAKAMSIWGMGLMVGPIMGPVLGGLLTENYDWRWVFYINVPIGAVTLALLVALLPTRPKRERKFDITGFALLAIALCGFQLVLDRGNHVDWFTSTEIWIEMAICAGAAWMFVIHMFTGSNTLFERELLTDRNLMTCLFFMVIMGVVMFTSMALLPPMLQSIYGYPVVDTGYLLAARGIGTLVAMFMAGRLSNTIDPRLLVSAGLVIAAASLWQMTLWSPDMDWTPIVICGVIQGLGLGLVLIPLNIVAFATLSSRFRTDGAGLLNLCRSLGASVGIAIATAILAMNVQVSHSDLASHVTDSAVSAIDSSIVQRFGIASDTVFTVIDGIVNKQALMIAYINDFWLMMLITILSVPLVLLLKKPVRKPGEMPPMIE